MEKEPIKDTKIAPDQRAVIAEAASSRANKKPSALRTATDQQFKKAQRKTSAQHAELFRRLAK